MHESIQVGTKMIVVKGDGKPVVDEVGRMTKTMFTMKSDNGNPKGQQVKWRTGWGPGIKPRFVVWVTSRYDSKRSWKAFLYTEENWEKVNQEYQEQLVLIEENKRQKKEKQEKREAEEQQRMDEVRQAVGGEAGLLFRLRSRDTMPDGTRLYWVDAPVHPELKERKKGWERVLVKCVDTEEPDWSKIGTNEKTKIRKTECAYTYCNGSSSSFSSVSTNRYVDDKAAIWDCLYDVYFR